MIQANINTYEFFAGVTEIAVPDQTRTAIVQPCFCELDLNPVDARFSRRDHACQAATARMPGGN